MFDAKETLTHDEILARFKKIFKRDMTPQEKMAFFLSLDKDENSDFQGGINRAPDPL